MTTDKCPTCGRKFATSNGASAESRKQAKDKARAESAIVALERVLANPTGILARAHIDDQLAPSFLDAVRSERLRLQGALADPEALRAIYRRNEKGARP